MQKIMIINSGIEQIDLIKTAKNMGLYIIATDAAPDAPGFLMADETFVVEPRNPVELLSIARKSKIDAVISDQCDYSFYAQAYSADILSLPGPGMRAAQYSTNKKWMRQACKLAGIKQPQFIPCKTLEEVKDAVLRIGFPCIVKPVDNRGNFGVNKVEEIGQVEEAFYEAIGNSHSRECLVEEFIVGTMITVDGFAFGDCGHRSLQVASKIMLGGRKRVAMEIDYPAEVSEDMQHRLMENHHRVALALGVRSGCTHGEYMLTDRGEIYLIECANRGGGCYTSSRIAPAVSGYDLSEMLILQALGNSLTPRSDVGNMKAAAVLRFFELPAGRILKIENEDLLRNYEDVLAFYLDVGPGDVVQAITNDANRHGFVISKGASLQLARQISWEIESKLVIQYEQ